MKKIILGLSLALLLASCQTQRYYLKSGAHLGKPTVTKSLPMFIGGLVGQPVVVNPQAECKGKTPVAVETQRSFLDILLGSITVGIYTPKTMNIYCE